MTSTLPARTRTQGFGMRLGMVCSMNWSMPQKSRETAAQATPSRMMRKAFQTVSSGAVSAKRVGAMPKVSEQP